MADNTRGEIPVTAERILEVFGDADPRHITALFELDTLLRAASEPMPVLKVAPTFFRGFNFPSVWMGYGFTEPGKGLMEVQEKYKPKDVVPKIGFRLPMHNETRGSISYHLLPQEQRPEQTKDGWLQHWHQTGYAHYSGDGEQLYARDVDGIVAHDSDEFAVWADPNSARISSTVFFDTGDPERVGATSPQGLMHRRVIAVGQRTVKHLLQPSVIFPRIEQPQPFVYMREFVVNQLGVESGSAAE